MKEVTISARDFVRAGGTITLEQWLDFDDEERAAFAEAGDSARREAVAAVVECVADAVREIAQEASLARLAAKAEEMLK